MSAPLMRRARADIAKLVLQGGFDVEVVEELPSLSNALAGRSRDGGLNLKVTGFRGPAGSPYEAGHFELSIYLPLEYPLRSPSVGFSTRIFHPNIDERSGSVCLDVLNAQWSPLYDLTNVVQQLLPQLLVDPNPLSPLNGEAAHLLSTDPKAYDAHVREHTATHARARPRTSLAAAASGPSAAPLPAVADPPPASVPGEVSIASLAGALEAAAAGEGEDYVSDGLTSPASNASKLSELSLL